jgi:hypothetical protein
LSEPIDAVITWVDGADPVHLEARARYLGKAQGLGENALNPHRWADNDEISYCLASLETHAPWLRRIWIVAARGAPDLSGLSVQTRAKIEIVRHEAIFDGLGDVLPTFNSLAIESVLWRIEELAERFLYFNDDVFLTAPLEPRDVFDGDVTVLRGRWADYSAVISGEGARDDPALFNHFMQVNAAGLLGHGPERIFNAAHVAHGMRRSVMQQLSEAHRGAFEENVAFRFRDLAQFLPMGVFNHAVIGEGAARFLDTPDHVHLYSGIDAGAARVALARVGTRFLCVNDLPQLEREMPEIRDVIAGQVARVP